MALIVTGPLLRNVLNRCGSSREQRDDAEKSLAYGGALGAFIFIREQYSGPFRNIKLKPYQRRLPPDNEMKMIGYALYASYGGMNIIEIGDSWDEVIKHGVLFDIPEAHRASVRGKNVSQVLEYDPLLSEFWTGEEIISSVKHTGREGIFFEVAGLQKRYV